MLFTITWDFDVAGGRLSGVDDSLVKHVISIVKRILIDKLIDIDIDMDLINQYIHNYRGSARARESQASRA